METQQSCIAVRCTYTFSWLLRCLKLPLPPFYAGEVKSVLFLVIWRLTLTLFRQCEVGIWFLICLGLFINNKARWTIYKAGKLGASWFLKSLCLWTSPLALSPFPVAEIGGTWPTSQNALRWKADSRNWYYQTHLRSLPGLYSESAVADEKWALVEWLNSFFYSSFGQNFPQNAFLSWSY